jgi:hypothetical protein
LVFELLFISQFCEFTKSKGAEEILLDFQNKQRETLLCLTLQFDDLVFEAFQVFDKIFTVLHKNTTYPAK